MQAEHYDRTRQQQVDIGLLAPEEAQASAEQVLLILCYFRAFLAKNQSKRSTLQCLHMQE